VAYAIGKKVGMTHIYDKYGKSVAVTAVLLLPTTIIKRKTAETDGYEAIKVAVHSNKTRRQLTKPVLGQSKKYKIIPILMKEFRVGEKADLKEGDSLAATQFKPEELLRITGVTKGKGFAGVVKRYGFKGGPKSHGSHHHRTPGSIGAQQPQRVVKGKKMAGHMGAVTNTLPKVKIAAVWPDENIILLKGALPGPKGSILKISRVEKR
jgi:large subunit ribosomal protein L3